METNLPRQLLLQQIVNTPGTVAARLAIYLSNQPEIDRTLGKFLASYVTLIP